MKSLTAKNGNGNGFHGVVPVEPSVVKPSKFNFNKDTNKAKATNMNTNPGNQFSKGRKIVDASNAAKKSSSEKNESSPRARRKQVVSVDDVDKLLEDDAAALQNMKKDIHSAQEKEVLKAREYLSSLQKESNALKISNDAKSKQYDDLIDTRRTLESYITKGQKNVESCHRVIDDIREKLKDVEEEMSAEINTREMMNFMRHRLEQEIFAIKSSTHELNQKLEQVRSEFANVDSAVRITKLELAAEERHVESLLKAIRERADQRIVKKQQLQSLVNEGENSVARVQESIRKPQGGDALKAWDMIERGESLPHPSNVTSRNPRLEKSNSYMDEDSDDNNLKKTTINLTKEKIKEVLDWYQSKESRIQELMQVQSDLKENISKERTKKLQIESLLERSRNKVLLLASNRQMYQEVDMKDAALASARREGDEFQEKDYRLKKNIEALRRSIPRFLQKIMDGGLGSSDCNPIPIDQLPDVVHKLEDEIARLIKQIGEKMLKDATQEDLANMSSSIQEFGSVNNNDNTASETSRLHKLPGYNRLQKQLFNNLMSAIPDSSSANVRVNTETKYKDDVVFNPNADLVMSSGGARKINNDGVIDRQTIKSISQLVAKRDNPGKTAPNKEIIGSRKK